MVDYPITIPVVDDQIAQPSLGNSVVARRKAITDLDAARTRFNTAYKRVKSAQTPAEFISVLRELNAINIVAVLNGHIQTAPAKLRSAHKEEKRLTVALLDHTLEYVKGKLAAFEDQEQALVLEHKTQLVAELERKLEGLRNKLGKG